MFMLLPILNSLHEDFSCDLPNLMASEVLLKGSGLRVPGALAEVREPKCLKTENPSCQILPLKAQEPDAGVKALYLREAEKAPI